MMRRSKYGEEQIIGILKEHDAGLSTPEILPEVGGEQRDKALGGGPCRRHARDPATVAKPQAKSA